MIKKNLLEDTSFDAMMDPYLPKGYRIFLENRFYAKVGEQAKLQALKQDASFHKNPINHIGLYSDHSVVHVRDVAMKAIELIEKINGILIPQRADSDLEFLKAYALQLVYLHDIGMAIFSDFGRFMHPEFAAQFVFSPDFDELLDLLWEKDAGGIPDLLKKIFSNQQEKKVKLIYRELLTLSVAHSKSKIPIDFVNDPVKLRKSLLNMLSKPLELLYYEQKISRFEKKLDQLAPDSRKAVALQKKIATQQKKKAKFLEKQKAIYPPFQNKYDDHQTEAFSWLLKKEANFQRLIINIQDVLRCIRAADALRQRGTVLRTSAGYEIFIDRKTANAVYALRNETNNELYLLQSKKRINAGEANLASSELDSCGNLRVSFHLGAFYKKRIVRRAAQNVAVAINDIQADVIQSFQRNPLEKDSLFKESIVSAEGIKILLEATNDNPEFVPMVRQSLEKLNPTIAPRIKKTYSLQGYDLSEISRYLAGTLLSSLMEDENFKSNLFKDLEDRKLETIKNHTTSKYNDIRVIQLKKGEQLIKGGSSSGFVYYPMSDGLMVHPLGGYEPRLTPAWIPLGNSGVIRGAVRNADVFAQKEVRLLCIPKDVYLKHWYKPYTGKDLLNEWKVSNFVSPT